MSVELYYLSHNIFKDGLATAEQRILQHLTSCHDEQVVEEFKEFFTDVRSSMSLELKSTHRLTIEEFGLSIEVDLSEGILRFEDESNDRAARKKG